MTVAEIPRKESSSFFPNYVEFFSGKIAGVSQLSLTFSVWSPFKKFLSAFAHASVLIRRLVISCGLCESLVFDIINDLKTWKISGICLDFGTFEKLKKKEKKKKERKKE